MWQILLKKKSFTKYLNITDYLSSNISINSKLSTQLKTFDLSFTHIQDLDGNRVKLEQGDRIAITKDENYNDIKLFGRIKKISKPVLYWNEDTEEWEQEFNISCREPNFAINRVKEIYQNQLLSYILNDLLSKASNLGGVKSTGEIITRFKLTCSDITIPYFSVDSKSLLDAIAQLCKENNLFFRLDYFSEPNTDELIKIFSQLIIMNENGETAPEPYNIINDETILTGLLNNPNFTTGSTTEPEFYYGFTLPITPESDGDDIKNDLLILAKVIDENGVMERYTPDAIDGLTSYVLPSAANDIYYVSNNKLIGCCIKTTVSPTTTEFTVDKTQIIHMKTGDVLRIVSTDQAHEDFRTISALNNSTGRVTISLALSFTPSGNELVEIAHNTPIYKENDPALNYERTGCIIRTSSTDKASIEFLPFSVPGRPNKLLIYYSKINIKPIRQINNESKEDYELNTFDYEIKKPITVEQLKEIQRRAEQNEINDSLTIKAFLPTIPLCGWNTQINLTGVLNKNLRLNSVKSKYWATQEEDYYNLDIIEHTLEYSNKNNSFETYLKNLERSLELTSLSAYQEQIKKVSENISISEEITITKNTPTPPLGLQIDAYTLIAWDLNEGSGSSVTSTSPASENGSIQGTSTSLWQTGTPIDTYRIVLNGTDNYIETVDNNVTIEDFTIRLPLRFTEDDLIYGYHVLASKYDTLSTGTANGGVLYLEYDVLASKLYFGVSDDTSTFGTPKYRAYEVPFTAIADQEYIIQASFMLQDPSNSNLNKFTVCIDGVEVLGTFTETISNIGNLFQTNIKYRLGAYKTTSGTYYGRFSAYKFYFDLTYRNEAYALIDAQNIGLA